MGPPGEILGGFSFVPPTGNQAKAMPQAPAPDARAEEAPADYDRVKRTRPSEHFPEK
jgi:hypothetical protein